LVPVGELASLDNPPEGFIATANDDRNQPGKPLSINVCQGSYRVERIAELLSGTSPLTLADMQAMQADLLSPQARRFMVYLRPLIPDTPAGRVLAEWDLRYDTHSRGATLFEAFYQAALKELFGKGLFGEETWQAIVSTTNLLGAYFQVLDEALLSGDEAWFGGRGRDAVFKAVLEEVLAEPVDNIRPWGAQRQVTMRNLFFGGKLPGFISRMFGVDYGPFALPGGRATLVQGQIFESHGRPTSFAPSYRSVSDMGTDEVHTALAGGPSGRIGSRLYVSDVARWLAFQFKTLRGD
jgi:penicillin amidase